MTTREKLRRDGTALRGLAPALNALAALSEALR
jgi:hypothetical protein